MCAWTNITMDNIYLFGVGAAAISASSNAFIFYSSGILTATSGCTGQPNFWVALVGFYQSSLSTSYWQIQNSWGTGWGEQGYAKIAISQPSAYTAGVCGI